VQRTATGAYYLDETALAAYRRRRAPARMLLVVALLAGAVLLLWAGVRVRTGPLAVATLAGVVGGVGYLLAERRRADVRAISPPLAARRHLLRLVTTRARYGRTRCPMCGSAGPHWVQAFSRCLTLYCTTCRSAWAVADVEHDGDAGRN
jgi:hypothetical protein